jgi:hypothetical protein
VGHDDLAARRFATSPRVLQRFLNCVPFLRVSLQQSRDQLHTRRRHILPALGNQTKQAHQTHVHPSVGLSAMTAAQEEHTLAKNRNGADLISENNRNVFLACVGPRDTRAPHKQRKSATALGTHLKAERHRARQHEIQDNSTTPHVTRFRVLPEQHLWGDVVRGAARLPPHTGTHAKQHVVSKCRFRTQCLPVLGKQQQTLVRTASGVGMICASPKSPSFRTASSPGRAKMKFSGFKSLSTTPRNHDAFPRHSSQLYQAKRHLCTTSRRWQCCTPCRI